MKQNKDRRLYIHPELLMIPIEVTDCICTSIGTLDPSVGDEEFGVGFLF